MLRTMTVRDLIARLEGEDPDMPVIFTADYGDYHHTAQALRIRGEIDEVQITESGYSASGYALVERDADHDDPDEIEPATYLVIR
jgi:hypothetical protein